MQNNSLSKILILVLLLLLIFMSLGWVTSDSIELALIGLHFMLQFFIIGHQISIFVCYYLVVDSKSGGGL